MLQKACILLFPLLFLLCNLFANERQLNYSQHLTIADNLSHNGVTAMLEDSRGYLWISTYDGLNRYDGYEFKVFKNTVDDKIFPSNRIRAISEDKNGALWIGTDNGVAIYDYPRQRFSTVYSNKITDAKKINGPIIRKIVMNTDNDLVICTTENEGIIVLKDDHSFVKTYLPPDDFSDSPITIFEGIALDKNNYLFSSTAGLFYFNVESETFSMVYENKMKRHGSIFKISENQLLATLSKGFGIFTFNKNAGVYSFNLQSIQLNEYDIRSANLDVLGNLWMGTQLGGVVHVINFKALLAGDKYIKEVFTEASGRLRNSCVVSSARNGCWVGSFNKGIYRFHLGEKAFLNYNPNLKYGFLNRLTTLSHIAPLDDNRVYMASGRSGLVLLNTKTHKYEPIPFSIPDTKLGSVASVFVDSKKTCWLQTNEDFVFYRVKKGSKTLEKVDVEKFVSRDIGHARIITEDKQGNLWLGTITNVYKVNLNTNGNVQGLESLNKHPFFKNKPLSLVRYIYVDPLFDFVWICTDADGLFRITLVKGEAIKEAKVDHFVHDINNALSLSSNFVSSIVRLPNNELWLATEGGGICKVLKSDKEPEFLSFSEKNGLSNNVVKSMQYDEEYNLWISTNIGLNRFDTKDFTFRSFRSEDGLPFEDFFYASGKLANGMMVFSGIADLCYFDPKHLPDSEILPALVFSDFKIHNKSILPGDTVSNRILFDGDINALDEIILKYNENVFSFELSSLHFATPENHFLRYQLFPVNEVWVEVPSSQRTINYNGLAPGKYELRVMASNSLNQWSEPKTLSIIIEPPFWITAPAFILYFLLIAFIIYSVMYYILRMNKLSHKLEIEHLEKENVKDVNDAKLRFFSNISHEIKTPLTLISGPINLMSERYKGNTDLNDKLKIVQRQAKKIAQLVEQVHDFQRADANKLKMNFSEFRFDTFINDLLLDFRFLASHDNKKLELKKSVVPIYVSADKDKLEKVINNVLNNAFKYTKEGDSIVLEYSIDNKDLILSVKDTGKGIDVDDLPHVFERFYQSKHKHSAYIGGAGIGLAFSKRLVEMHYGYIGAQSVLNEGTTIEVKLPIVTEQAQKEHSETESQILLAEQAFHDEIQEKENIDPSKIHVDGAFSGAKIFFAEDNADMRSFVSGVLSKFYTVKSFANGRELLEALKEEWPDLILSDVLMPELNGFDLCKQIKNNIKTSHIPVILLTACTTIEEQLKGIREGADSYIKKPFIVQHVVTRIEMLLQNRKQLRERYQIDFPLTLEKKESSGNDITFLAKLYDLMEENLDNTDLDMDQLAKKMYLNRTHFFQKVKALTNQTPYELLKMYRLKRAAELLVQKHLSVNEVYMMTGFKSRSNFSKLFKDKYNSTPGKYATDALSDME